VTPPAPSPSPITLALVQQQPPADFDASLRRGLDAYVEAAENDADLVVFPELAFTPVYP
jgi:predicted amidohydrolase